MKVIRYERQVCTRCGGSGQFSYNAIDGSRCYGCGGSGQQLTRNGKAAKKRVAKMIDDMCTVPVSSIVAGQSVYVSVGLHDAKKYHRAITGAHSQVSGGSVGEDGKVTPFLALDFAKGTHCFHQGATIRRRPTADEWRTIATKADTWKGATVEQ